MELNSRRISWLGLALVTLIVASAGLVGNRQVVSSLEREYTQRTLDHSRQLSESLFRLLEESLAHAASEDEALESFRRLTRSYDNLSGTSIYLLDSRGSAMGAPLAGSESQAVAPELLRASDAVEAWKLQEGQEHTFTYGVRRLVPGSGEVWALVVRTDVGELFRAMHRVHYRLSALLLFAVGVVAAASFFTLRHLGGRYERHLRCALAERTAQLERAHADVLHKARLATLGQTTSMLVHEIRNPLASIKFGLSDLLASVELPKRNGRRLQIALREVDRLNEMLTDALGYVRPVRLADAPVALESLLEQVAQLLAPALEERKLRLVCELQPDCPLVRADPRQLEQVLLNLLKNAIEASPEGDEVAVRLHARSTWISLEVHNRGEPISPAQQQRLFEPFSSSKPHGTGLGLMLVKRVVEEHGGGIFYSSTEAQGTTFGFRLRHMQARAGAADARRGVEAPATALIPGN
jgi:signal transduction histidine kinase